MSLSQLSRALSSRDLERLFGAMQAPGRRSLTQQLMRGAMPAAAAAAPALGGLGQRLGGALPWLPFEDPFGMHLTAEEAPPGGDVAASASSSAVPEPVEEEVTQTYAEEEPTAPFAETPAAAPAAPAAPAAGAGPLQRALSLVGQRPAELLRGGATDLLKKGKNKLRGVLGGLFG